MQFWTLMPCFGFSRAAVIPKSLCFKTISILFIFVFICVHPVHLRLKNPNSKYLWYKLSANALECIQNPVNTLFVSPAILWEISIKDSLGKLTLPHPFEELFPARFEASKILILPILVPHLHVQRRLAYHRHDPFDRLVIAQALAEDLTLVSCDSEFPPYGVKLLW